MEWWREGGRVRGKEEGRMRGREGERREEGHRKVEKEI